MPRPHKPDDVFCILREHDPRFVVLVNRGKGSHRMVFHPSIDGQKRSFPLPYHRGKEIQRGLLKALIRRFNLPNDLFD